MTDKWWTGLVGNVTMGSSEQISWPQITNHIHNVVGLYILVAGVSGSLSNMTLLTIHMRIRDKLMDPTGVLLCNFLLMNLGMSILQFPFSASSSFAGTWLYGDTGCQLYAALGFFFGIGVVIGLGLMILEGFLIVYGLASLPRTNQQSFLMIGISWMFLLSFVIPPYLDIFGRFGLEPSGTACTIDYWHGNFRNYNYYVLYLTIMAYVIPITTMLVLFLKSVAQIQEKEASKRWSVTFTQHQVAMIKVFGLLFLIQISCWTPYAVLCLWTTILPPETLNVYYTLLPSICCKLCPILNALVIWWNVPRVTAGFFYLKRGRKGRMPQELFDHRLEMNKKTSEELEKEALAPGSG